MSHFVLITFLCIFIAFSVFMLKEMGYLKVFLKTGSICFLLLLFAAFLYGLFNDFSFIHGHSSAGLDAAGTYLVLVGTFVGPVVFCIGGLCGAIVSYRRKTKSRNKAT